MQWMTPGLVRNVARVSAARVEMIPFPHLLCDHVLTEAELSDAIRHWPDSSHIPEETAGSGYKVAHLRYAKHRASLTPTQIEYWEHFLATTCVRLVRELFSAFAPWIVAKFGNLVRDVGLVTVALTEYESDTTSLGAHVHSHDPTWLFTTLIHVDDGDNVNAAERGNAMFGFDGCTTEAAFTDELYFRMASVSPHHLPIEGLRIQKDHGFKPGRLFSFFETPISYHGSRVHGSAVQSSGRRRMIRMHAWAPNELTKALYGIDYEDYKRLKYPRSPAELDPRVIPWMKRDVHNMFHPVTGVDLRDLARSVSIRLPTLWG